MIQSHITVKTDERTVFIPVPEVDYIESAANYVVIHSAGQSHIMRATLTNLMACLPDESFVRISRAVIVRVSFLAEVRQTGRRERVAILKNGRNLPMTRSVRDIRQRIEHI